MFSTVPSSFSFMMNPSLVVPLVLGPLVVGLLFYIYAFCSQRHKLRPFGQSLVLAVRNKESELQGVQNTHLCLFTLLVLDALTALFGLIMVVFFLISDRDDHFLARSVMINLWLVFRWLGVSQHLITSLVSVLFLYRPKWGFGLRSLGKLLDLVPFILVIVAFRISSHVLIGIDIFNFLVIVAIVVSWLLNAPTVMGNQRKHFGILAVCLYFLVCLPNTVLSFLLFHSDKYLQLRDDVLYVTSFYFIMDAVLFYLVLKINEEEQEYEGAIRCD